MLILGMFDIPWWILIIIVIVIFLGCTTRDFGYFKKQGIPGHRPMPLIGTMYLYCRKSLGETVLDSLEMSREKGCVGGFMGSIPTLEVHDEEMLSQIMVKEFSSFTNRLSIRSGSLSDKMLLMLHDDHWRHVRNGISPTFTTGRLKRMNVEVNRCARILADNLAECAKSGEIVEMKKQAGAYTMDAVGSTAFGLRLESHKDINNAFTRHAKKAFNMGPMVVLRVLLPRLSALLNKLGYPFEIIPKDTQAFFYDIAKQTMEMRKLDANQTRSDFLQLMLNSQRGELLNDDDENEDSETTDHGKGSGLSTEEILANAILFFIAGYDTTATSLGFFMYNMALYPDCQERLFKEIDQVIGEQDFIDYSLLQEMPYLDQCVNESLRLYSPTVIVNRETNRDVTINGIFIRKGVTINIPIFGIHRDPTKWPDPERFDPERFSSENKKDRNPYHFLPFGNGPRNCIGMRLALLELKIAIIHVLKNMRVSTCEKTSIPMEFSLVGPQLNAKDGVWLKVELRK